MSILSVVKQAATSLGIDVPTQVYSSTDREMVEMQTLANEMAVRIAKAHDWTRLKAIGTLTGTGIAESFPFPTGYDRMVKTARMWPSASPFATLTHYADADEWLGQTVQSFNPIIGGWTLIGESIHIRPAVANTATVSFYYVTNLIVKDAGGTPKESFTLDTDLFRLDERLLKLAIVWQWKASKGLPYAEDITNFEEALAQNIGADKGSNILRLGRRNWPFDVDYAFPGVIVP